MTKTPEQLAEEYVDQNSGGECSDDTGGLRDAFLAGYQVGQEHPFQFQAKMWIDPIGPQNQWISVKDRLPTDADGVTQLWMRGRSLAELVLGCHAVMFEHNEKIEGVLDMNKPDGLWDLSDFTHWMPLPKPPEDK